jgi:hypothetical protein
MAEQHIAPPFEPFKDLPYRLATVVVVAALAWAVSLIWSRSGEAAYVVPALSLAGISILLALWPLGFALNFVAGIALFVLRKRRIHPLARWTNRQIGHFEALFTWLTYILVRSHGLIFEAAATAALFALGPAVVDAAGYFSARKRPQSHSKLNCARRPFFYLATFIGLLLLATLDLDQARTLLPLDFAVLAGLSIRTVYYFMHAREDEDRPLRRRWREIDRGLIAVAVAAAILVPLYELKSGFAANRKDHEARAIAERISCDPRSTAFAPEASLFLVSDNQFHALDGQRSGLQLDLVDAVVPVAARPVALDLLSAATLDHFAGIYRELLHERPSMLWAHLGDIGDVGCKSELQRFEASVLLFGRDQLAALAPGNHDSTFLGNFDWHPEWSKACPGGRSSHP